MKDAVEAVFHRAVEPVRERDWALRYIRRAHTVARERKSKRFRLVDRSSGGLKRTRHGRHQAIHEYASRSCDDTLRFGVRGEEAD